MFATTAAASASWPVSAPIIVIAVYTPAMSFASDTTTVNARGFELLDLILGLRHRAHQQHLRRKRDDLLDIRLHAGLHGGHVQHLRRIVAEFAAANEQIPRTDGVEHFAVRRAERDHAGRGFG